MNCIYCNKPCGTHYPEPVCWNCKMALDDDIEDGLIEMESAIADAGIWLESQVDRLNRGQRVALGMEV